MIDDSLRTAVLEGLKGELEIMTVYKDAASVQRSEVGDFFREMAMEEKLHYNWLLWYYKQLRDRRIPEANLAEKSLAAEGRGSYIKESFVRSVGENLRLVTAVAAAVLLESESVRRYRKESENKDVPALSEFFGVLADWEDRHYRDLLLVQEGADRYWFDSQTFEPL